MAGVDYTAVMGTLTFAPRCATRTFTMPILNDSVPEPDEKFDVVLRNAADHRRDGDDRGPGRAPR